VLKIFRLSKAWRAVIFNLILAFGFTIAEMLKYLSIVDWRDFIDEHWAPWVVVAINLLNVAINPAMRRRPPDY